MANLYAEPNESFVERRNELVKEIRGDGDRVLAAQVKALRKPSAVAGELNRIVRDNPSGVSDLITAVDALQEGQAALVARKSVDFASLQSNYRALVQALSSSAPEAYRYEVKAAIEAAALDSDGRRRLSTGTFVTVPSATGGFGFPTDFVVPASSPKTSGRKAKKAEEAQKAKPSKKSKTPATDKATLERERFRRRATIAAEANVASTEKAVTQANVRVKEVESEIAVLETKISELRVEHHEARENLELAVEAARQATADLAELGESIEPPR